VTSVLVLVVALHAPPARPAPLPVYHPPSSVLHAGPIINHQAPLLISPVRQPHPVLHLPDRPPPVYLPVKRAVHEATLQTNTLAFPNQIARPRWVWPGSWNPVAFWQLNPYCFGASGSYWGEWGMLATPNDANVAYQYGPWGGSGNAWLLGSGLQTFCGAPAFIGL
jgi:hypothetical protein